MTDKFLREFDHKYMNLDGKHYLNNNYLNKKRKINDKDNKKKANSNTTKLKKDKKPRNESSRINNIKTNSKKHNENSYETCSVESDASKIMKRDTLSVEVEVDELDDEVYIDL